MKVKVVESFIDKYTGNVHLIDEAFECTKERFEEIEKAGHYVEKVTDEPKLKVERKPKEHGIKTTNI